LVLCLHVCVKICYFWLRANKTFGKISKMSIMQHISQVKTGEYSFVDMRCFVESTELAYILL